MEQLKAKLKKQGGFTMVELLIVVAIIAILVAVSIPMMNNALERSRHAVDQANVRDAIALATIEYLTSDKADFKDGKTYTYATTANHQGALKETLDAADQADYTDTIPQCSCSDFNTPLKVNVDADGKIIVSWIFNSTSGATENNTSFPTT